MHKVTFIFAKNKKKWAFISRIIEKSEGLDFSHSAILIADTVYESVWPKSRKMNIKDWYKTYVPYGMYSFSCDELTQYRVKSQCESRTGIWYSWFQILMIYAGIICPFLNPYLEKINWNGHKYLICTELCGEIAANNFGVKFEEELDNLSLRELRDCIEANIMRVS
jgi:hypothetical protein